MHALPHNYLIRASSSPGASVVLTGPGVPPLETEAPPEFGGPGNIWSPEHMLAGSVANCFILSFRAVAGASKLPWVDLDCDVDAVLSRVDRVTRFTQIIIKATLQVPAGTDADKATRLLEKAKKICLITNSMTAEITLETQLKFSNPMER